jgi:hypothetical protein
VQEKEERRESWMYYILRTGAASGIGLKGANR